MLTFQRQLVRNFKQLRHLTISSALSCKNDSNEKNDSQNIEEKEKKTNKDYVNTKLNDLLQMMAKKDEEPVKAVKVPQAKKREQVKPVKEKPLGEQLADAAKDVAKSLGDDVQKTESELLNILLKRSEPSTQVLKDVLSGMKIDKETADTDSRAKQVRDTLAGQSVSKSMYLERKEKYKTPRRARDPTKMDGAPVDILGAKPSSYFTDLQPAPAPCELNTWQSCVQRDLRLASTHPPSNIYEQMIQWTDRGMLWQFPIDNEQGLEDDKQVSFEEHIFLEVHLEGWCPERGPVRHFMELVCVGLSKNHWLSAEEKRNHIYWFRDYFMEKKQLLKDLGAGNIGVEANEQKQISQ